MPTTDTNVYYHHLTLYVQWRAGKKRAWGLYYLTDNYQFRQNWGGQGIGNVGVSITSQISAESGNLGGQGLGNVGVSITSQISAESGRPDRLTRLSVSSSMIIAAGVSSGPVNSGASAPCISSTLVICPPVTPVLNVTLTLAPCCS